MFEEYKLAKLEQSISETIILKSDEDQKQDDDKFAPHQNTVIIVSNDSDLDHTIELLKSQGRSAERIGIEKKKNNSLSNINYDPLKTYCKYLITSKGKPAKKETLMNSINSKFKGMPEVAENVFQELINQSIIEIMENGNVIYDLVKLNQFKT